MKMNHIIIKTSILLLLIILCLSLAKEGIIHSLNYTISSWIIWFVALISSIFTCFYSIKIILYCAIYFGSVYSGYISLVVPILILSSLLIDESFYYIILFNISFCESLLPINLFIIDIKFSIVLFLIACFAFKLITLLLLIPVLFISNSSFFTTLFQDVSLIFSSYWCSAPINYIEVFTSYSSSYSYYVNHYFSNHQFITFIFLMLIFIVLLF